MLFLDQIKEMQVKTNLLSCHSSVRTFNKLFIANIEKTMIDILIDGTESPGLVDCILDT